MNDLELLNLVQVESLVAETVRDANEMAARAHAEAVAAASTPVENNFEAAMASVWAEATASAIAAEIEAFNKEIEEAGKKISAEKIRIEKRVAEFKEFLQN